MSDTSLDGTKGYKLKSTQEVQEQVVEKHLTFKLTEQDFAEKGKEAGHVAGELAKLEAEFDGIKREWKEKIEARETELSTILGVIRRREEERKVKCIEQKDFNEYMVHYIFNGEIMHSRPMEMHERQMELVRPVEDVSKENEVDSMKGQLHVLDSKDKDIRDVMKSETNKKTKQDLSNRGH